MPDQHPPPHILSRRIRPAVSFYCDPIQPEKQGKLPGEGIQERQWKYNTVLEKRPENSEKTQEQG